MKKTDIPAVKTPDRVLSYFAKEKSVLSVVTVTGLLYNIGMAAGPYFEGKLAQCLYDIITKAARPSAMLKLALLYVAVILLVQAARALKRYYVRIFANDISRIMRHVLYHSLVHKTEKQLGQETLGSLLTKAISDVDACAEGMRKVTTEIFDTGVVMIVYLVMLAVYDWRLTLLSILFTPLAYLIAERLKKQVSSANAAYRESASLLNQMTMDRVSHAVTYRLFGREDNRNEAYETQLTDYEAKSARANIFEGSLTPVYDAFAMTGTVMILYFGSKNVLGTGWTSWDIAGFTTFLACFTKLAVKTSHAAKLFNAVQKARVSWKRIQPLLTPVREPEEPDSPVEPLTLTFRKVTCGYQNDTVLSNLSFTARPGEIIGITGVVASGKSMLGKVLLGQVPYTGSIFLGDTDFAPLSDREKVSYITYMGHEPELLSAPISENVSLGDNTDIDKWLSAVCLDRDLAQMRDGSDTSVGASGTELSGGQQARLALARTLAHARSVLVLDDPFAAVDRATETEILKNLRRLMPDRVILLISHRLYHFPEFDHVLFLHDGTAEFSDHAELMKTRPDYANLYDIQRNGGDLDE